MTMSQTHNRTHSRTYTGPVAQLLTYRRLTSEDWSEPWPDYLELGLAGEHVPELIRMATDPNFYGASADTAEGWATLHAWRALAQLRAEGAVQPLLRCMEEQEDDDWLQNELPRVFSMIGPEVIPALEAWLDDDGASMRSRMSIPECLARLVEDHPGERDRCAGVLVRTLQAFATNDPDLNGLVIWALLDLGYTEAISLIREAYAANRVELQVLGDVEDVEMGMGLRIHRSTPPPRLGVSDIFRNAPPPASVMGRSGMLPARRGEKVGRNDPCPCGSGKKFKKCCLV